MSLIAITRAVSPAMGECELTHLARIPIDVTRAAAQHAQYEAALGELGCAVQRLSSGPDIPDAVFVEDTAVVLDEIAIVTYPGAPSRRPEISVVAEALEPFRSLGRIEPPGTMDGGDVLVVGRTIFVGCSGRTNAIAIAQMDRLTAPYGYTVRAITVRGCLHLKSAVSAAGDGTLVINRQWLSADELGAFDFIDVAPGEPGAANVVRAGDRILAAAAFPRTRERLEARGFRVTTVDVSEIAKAEGALTCCSLIFTTT